MGLEDADGWALQDRHCRMGQSAIRRAPTCDMQSEKMRYIYIAWAFGIDVPMDIAPPSAIITVTISILSVYWIGGLGGNFLRARTTVIRETDGG